MISIRGLHKYFNKGRQNEIHVINNVNLDLPDSGMVAIFGKSGCGKTTLLNVIGGLDGFADGVVAVDNQSIKENTDVIRNKYIGYIFQNYNLHKTESCFDNVADALRLCGMTDENEIERRVKAALTNVGMEKYARRTPDTLSGGQQQRIAIARAIVKNPRIILADEPTGNLDEANTVMIMDLLKAISRDHLVLLVTHEANLVDYYCDTVIELNDGKVVGMKSNSSANGFASRDKNDIYLGELEKTVLSDGNAEIEYYGKPLESPVKLRIVNNGGKLYLEVGTEKVQLIDGFSEVKLREGVYEEMAKLEESQSAIDMSGLPTVEGRRFGRLFSFASSVRSGYIANFKNRKRGKKLLRGCMFLFAAVIVFVSSVFGSAFGDIIDAKNSYNHNVFYLYTPSDKVSQKLTDAVGDKNTGIDFIRLTENYPIGDDMVFFRTGSFETFEQYDYESNFNTNAVYLDVSLTDGMKLVEGDSKNIRDDELLITTKVADELIKKSTLGYITERRDLIGLVSGMFTIDGKYPRIAGIVECDEPAVYMTELTMAKLVLQYNYFIGLASDYGLEVKKGETLHLLSVRRDGIKYPKLNDKIKLHGIEVTVSGIKEACYDYGQWLDINGIKLTEEYDFFADLVKKDAPSLAIGTPEFDKTLEKYRNERFFEYYDYYYKHIGDFCTELYFFMPDNIYLWMYVKKGVEDIKYFYVDDQYFKAVQYKSQNGSYPTYEKLMEIQDQLPSADLVIKEQMIGYEQEFHGSDRYYMNGNIYLLSKEDYILYSKRLGETHESAKPDEYGYEIKDEYTGFGNAEAYSSISFYDYETDYMYIGETYYTVIHSSDPEKTAAWLESEFSDIEAPYSYWEPMITPDRLFDSIIESKTEEIITSLITMGVMLALMSVCMYFIMRSSLMNRIKEVGIYRAIGVSKANLVFKFFIEAVVLTSLTVMLGYLATSAFMMICLNMSALVEQIFYYPLWLALADLVILYVISLFFGTLPIMSLLSKTPSEILAKYDI